VAGGLIKEEEEEYLMAVTLYKYALLHLAIQEQTKRVASIVRYLVFKDLLLNCYVSPLSV
jgi:hypothetical protein